MVSCSLLPRSQSSGVRRRRAARTSALDDSPAMLRVLRCDSTHSPTPQDRRSPLTPASYRMTLPSPPMCSIASWTCDLCPDHRSHYKNLAGGAFASNLAANAEVADMYLFPTPSNFLGQGAGDLDVSETATIKVTGKGLVVGGTDIMFRVFADADLDYLFPHFEDSATVAQKVDVKE
jgi:hypothetical protein